MENSTQMCDLRDLVRMLKQGDMDVTQYFNALSKLWQELDLYNIHRWHCKQDVALYRLIIDKEQIYDFVSGLNKDLDEVRGRTLAMRPLPKIDDIFAEVRREESRKKRMLGELRDPVVNDNAVMVVCNQDSPKNTVSWARKNLGSFGAITAVNRTIPVTLAGKYTESQRTGGR